MHKRDRTETEIERDVIGALKAEFLRLLTEDSVTNDARRREFNQAIFSKESGHAVFNGTDLTMVLSKFDRAVRNLR